MAVEVGGKGGRKIHGCCLASQRIDQHRDFLPPTHGRHACMERSFITAQFKADAGADADKLGDGAAYPKADPSVVGRNLVAVEQGEH